MITIFNRAVVMKDPSAETASKACAALNGAGIPCKLKKDGTASPKPAVRIPRTGRTGSMTSGFSGGPGIPYSWREGGSSSTYYIVYVAKKDLERAKSICGV